LHLILGLTFNVGLDILIFTKLMILILFEKQK